MRVDLYCPVCKAAGRDKFLNPVDSEAKGLIFPYCKVCKKNIPIFLVGDGTYQQSGDPVQIKKVH